jgi:hypothetical protein
MKNYIIALAAIVMVGCVGNRSRQMTLEDSDLEEQNAASGLPNGLRFAEKTTTLDTIIPTSAGVKYRGVKLTDPASPPVTLALSASLPEKALRPFDYYPRAEYAKLTHPLADKGVGFLGNVELRIIQFSFSNLMPDFSSVTYPVGDYIVAGDIYSGYHAYNHSGDYLYTLSVPEVLPERAAESDNRFVIRASDDSRSIANVSNSGEAFMIVTEQGRNNTTMEIHNPATQSVLSRPYSYIPGGEGRLQIGLRPTLFDSNTIAEVSALNPKPSTPYLLFKDAETGNTLAEYRSFNPPTDMTKLQYYNYPDPGTAEPYNGGITLRQPYNDTVYRVSSPQRLTPAYVLDLGENRVTLEDVITGNVKGKSIPRRWLETDKFILLTQQEGDAFWYDKASAQLHKIAPAADEMALLSKATSVGEGLNVTFTKSGLTKFMETEQFEALPATEQEKIANLTKEMNSGELLVMMLR